MIPALNAEFRKLVTTRSTWFLVTATFLLTTGLVGFWIFGYKDVSHAGASGKALLDGILTAINVIGVFLPFIAILLVGHEYRYNTITYSLTSVNHRSKLFFAKYLAAVSFILVVAAVLVLCMIVAFHIGQAVAGIETMGQELDPWSLVWRFVASVIGGVTFAFILSMLIRSLTGTIAVVIVLPSFIESLLGGLLLHENAKYLPYTALGNLTQLNTGVSTTFSLWVVCAYVAVVGAVAYALFLKRDAN